MEPVRILIALVLLLILPLQMTFAAGAEYCETGKSHSSHFGHHVHDAQDAQGSADGDQGGTGKTSGKLCAFCHLGCSQVQTSIFKFGAVGIQSHYTRQDLPLLSGIPPSVPHLPPRSSLV